MALAEVYSLRATCPRGRIGAVLVREGRPIAAGYNGAPAGLDHCFDAGCETGSGGGCSRTIHAEANAIAAAAKAGITTEGAELYVTLAPCLSCAQLIINTGVKSVIFRDSYRIEAGIRLLVDAGVHITALWMIEEHATQ